MTCLCTLRPAQGDRPRDLTPDLVGTLCRVVCGPVACIGLVGPKEDSPSPVYGAALLMRLGLTPFRGSNPRSSAP